MSRFMVCFCACLIFLTNLRSADLYVPQNYATIQSAIDAAFDGDTVHIGAGLYHEKLTITKSISLIGENRDTCILSDSTFNVPLISIQTDSVTIANLDINGGYYNGDFTVGASSVGLSAENTIVKLHNMQTQRIVNSQIKIHGGSCEIDNLILNHEDVWLQCDIGIDLIECDATIRNLEQTNGRIDHTINYNWLNTNPDIKSVSVDSCTIRASVLSWGDCIRSYGYSNLTITNCRLYREPGGEPKGVANHTGIGINGPYVVLTARDNVFDGVPWGIFIYGSFTGSNVARIESNTFQNCEIGGVQIKAVDYDAVDLGGGSWSSAGMNHFVGSALYDVQLDESSEDVFALNNSWSQTDPDDGIYDELDDSQLGRVIYQSLILEPPHIVLPVDGNLRAPWPPVLSWSLVRGALFYFVQISLEPDFKRNIEETTIFADTAFTPNLLSPGETYWWRVRAANYLTQSGWSDAGSFRLAYPEKVNNATDAVPVNDFALSVFPNPFNSATTIQFRIAEAMPVRIEVIDVRGKIVERIHSTFETAGMHTVKWNAENIASGVYFIKMSAGSIVEVQQILLLR